jgi:hypothetical protein
VQTVIYAKSNENLNKLIAVFLEEAKVLATHNNMNKKKKLQILCTTNFCDFVQKTAIASTRAIYCNFAVIVTIPTVF